MSSYPQGNLQAYPPPPSSYPPPPSEQVYTRAAYVAPPPMGYPTNGMSSYPQQVYSDTKNRGDGFWKGCCAALCCCCVLETCF